ncbi:hypothetical protein ACVWWO_008739 [Bradyrhizobium sp. F1.13.1]
MIDMDRTERFFAGMTIVGTICLCAAFTPPLVPPTEAPYFGGCHLGKVSHSVI